VIDRVTRLVRDTAASLVMPSFRSLRPEDIAAKATPGDPDDIVTITDKAAERHLMTELSGIVPDAVFVGEEAVCENPALVEALAQSAPAWLIDPIDGTKNFARGNPHFGIMLALVEGGVTRASWIALPATGDMVVAELGNGTRLNGTLMASSRVPARLRGTVHDRLMPAEKANRVRRSLRHRFEPFPSTGSAATEYAAILRGEKDFVIYYRLLPWDHAPGALVLAEAGGSAQHLDGRAYAPLSEDQITIFAATPAIASTIRGWLA
jgi:fructose-1,6-bisphosphatase/inositol monophosphatase family enzyme